MECAKVGGPGTHQSLLPNGQKVAYDINDIDISTLQASDTTGDAAKNGAPLGESKIDVPTPKHSGDLNGVAEEIHLSSHRIEIISEKLPGMPIKVPSPGEYSTWDQRHEQTLKDFDAAIAPIASTAKEVTDNLRRYWDSCRGATTTYNSGTASGTGTSERTGTVGSVPFTYDELSIWGGQYEGTSTTYHADTPFCRGLASELNATIPATRPYINSAANLALVSATVTNDDLDGILAGYGIAPLKFWD